MKFSKQIDNSLRNLDSLDEIVPFKRASTVKSGLSQKYNDLDAYTFGIELEFRPKGASDIDMDQLQYELSRDDDVMSDFITWRDEHSEKDNSNWDGNKDTWDDDYGALSVDTWDEYNPKPDKTDYEDEDEYHDALQQWNSDRADVEYEYDHYTHWDYYYDDFVQELINDDEWETYISRDSVTRSTNDEDVEELIEIAKEYIIYKLDEDVSDDGEAEKDLWGVGEDESGVVEIRSRHLTQNDFGLVKNIVNYVNQFEVGGDLSAHVHVGLPPSFDLFDLLAITTLVDEDSIKKIGDNRAFAKYADLRGALQRKIISRIKGTPTWTESETYTFTMTFADIRKLVFGLGKYYGTNILSMLGNKTIEFRYFSSEMARDTDRFIEWIKYFLLLPKIAEGRNRIVLSSGDDIYDDKLIAIRDGNDQIKFLMYRNNRAKLGMSGFKSSELKKNIGLYRTSKKLADKLQARKEANRIYAQLEKNTTSREWAASRGISEKYVGTIDRLDASNTELRKLPDAIQCVRGTCDLSYTKIISLNNLRWVGYDSVDGKKSYGSLYITDTKISELPSGLHIANGLYADKTTFITLPDDIDIGSDLSLIGSRITYLPAININGYLNVTNSNIEKINPNINVSGNLYIADTPLLRNIIKKYPKLKAYIGDKNDTFEEKLKKHNMFAEIIRPIYFPFVTGRIETMNYNA